MVPIILYSQCRKYNEKNAEIKEPKDELTLRLFSNLSTLRKVIYQLDFFLNQLQSILMTLILFGLHTNLCFGFICVQFFVLLTFSFHLNFILSFIFHLCLVYCHHLYYHLFFNSPISYFPCVLVIYLPTPYYFSDIFSNPLIFSLNHLPQIFLVYIICQ